MSFLRGWFNPAEVQEITADVYQRGRQTIHFPQLKDTHVHSLLSKWNGYGCKFPHLEGQGRALNPLCEFMLRDTGIVDDEEASQSDIYSTFIGLNRSELVLKVNQLPVSQSCPGGPFLLDSLVLDSKTSRYKIPSTLYLENLRLHRGVDDHTLQQVITIVPFSKNDTISPFNNGHFE